ncbi:MAG: DUF1223 domain-containing protein [Rhodospirillales bacterium]|nr:DUF1223 domain-containing protein [Rhodospirillales bacterium]
MKTHIRHSLKSLVLATALAALSVFPAVADNGRPLTVVELFTSQGCSSCPPADALLGELSKRADVLALSVHVDYWDYIGWKDPFASPKNTARQHRYAKTLGMRYVYTPQLVIQGADHVVGSDRTKILAKIAKAAKLDRVAVGIRRDGDGVRVSVPAAHGEQAAVWLAVYDSRRDTVIKRGENSGRTLSYYNVVRGMTRIGTWSGQAMDIRTSMADIASQGSDNCAVILQSLKTGRILGVARVALDKS